MVSGQKTKNGSGNKSLTTREMDAARLVSGGHHNIYKKLNIPNRATLTVICITSNLIGQIF